MDITEDFADGEASGTLKYNDLEYEFVVEKIPHVYEEKINRLLKSVEDTVKNNKSNDNNLMRIIATHEQK